MSTKTIMSLTRRSTGGENQELDAVTGVVASGSGSKTSCNFLTKAPSFKAPRLFIARAVALESLALFEMEH